MKVTPLLFRLNILCLLGALVQVEVDGVGDITLQTGESTQREVPLRYCRSRGNKCEFHASHATISSPSMPPAQARAVSTTALLLVVLASLVADHNVIFDRSHTWCCPSGHLGFIALCQDRTDPSRIAVRPFTFTVI